MKKCPFCGAELPDSARFCLYCMQSLTEKEQILPHKKKKPQWWIAVAVVGALLMLAMPLLPEILNPPVDDPALSATDSESTVYSTPANTAPSTQPSTVPATQPHIHSYSIENTATEYLKEAATCTQIAEYYYSCACGEKGSETFFYGKKAEHTVVIDDPGYPDTCLTPGLSEASHCAVCQTVISGQYVLTAKGHSYTSGDPNPVCSRCGEAAEIVIHAPELPFFQNDTFRINSYTYYVLPSSTSDSLWTIRLHINYTNISSDTIKTGITANLDGLKWSGGGWTWLEPNLTGYYSMNFNDVPAGTYDLVFE